MVTGWDVDIDQPKTGETGIDLVLLKPFDVDSLPGIVQSLLEETR